MPTYVEYGVADCGVAGPRRAARDGGRRARAARPRLRPLPARGGEPGGLGLRARPLGDDPRREQVREAWPPRTSWAAASRVEVVRLAGSVEIAPGLGLADCIVDVVETGRTLAENGLAEVGDGGRVLGPSRRQPRQLPRPARGGAGASWRRCGRPRDEDRRLPGRRRTALARVAAAGERAARRGGARGRGDRPRRAARGRRGARAPHASGSTACGSRRTRCASRPREIRAPRRAAPTRASSRRCGRMARQIEAFHRRQLAPGFRLRLADGSLLEEVRAAARLRRPVRAGRRRGLPLVGAHERDPGAGGGRRRGSCS